MICHISKPIEPTACGMLPNENNKDSMDELNKIIDRYTDGNYLIGKTAKEEMAKDILALFSVSETPKHVCGLQGYNPMIDSPCPACEVIHGSR